MLICLLMGYASGLPLLLTSSTLKAWMTEEQIDLGHIGLFASVALPYSLKFLWAPFFDRFIPPFLGRRRGHLLITQIFLMIGISSLGSFPPSSMLFALAVASFFVAFFSASQDIVIDSYRREYLEDRELGLGSTFYVYGYRVAMLLAGSGSLILADHMAWNQVYFVMALCLIPGLLTTLLAPEPNPHTTPPKTLRETLIDPFAEFFQRNQVKNALLILSFILLYKLGDQMASNMATPFYLKIGFTKTQIGIAGKFFGFWALLGGLFLGGSLILYLGIRYSLFFFGILQGLSTAGFALLYYAGNSIPVLSGVVAFENLSAGMGTSAFLAYMATQTNKKFTATQYALLTSVMAIPGNLLSAPAGYMAQAMGWPWFFSFCALVAIPGLLILWFLSPQEEVSS